MQLKLSTKIIGGPTDDILITQKEFIIIGNYIIDKIKTRTSLGKSLTGKKFGKYKDPKKNKPHIDLRDTYALMDGLDIISVAQDIVAVAVTGNAQNYYKFVEKKYPFLGLTKSEQNKIYKYIESVIYYRIINDKNKTFPKLEK